MNELQRWAARIEYTGTNYAGWQRLTHNHSVQAELEAALSKIAAHPVKVVAAGRTDSGVHSLGQVVHFDSPAARNAIAWALGCNIHLPPDVSVRWVQQVSQEFHARFGALSRRYRYVFHNSRTRSALLAGRATFWPHPLDAESMHTAVQHLVGRHDFTALRHTECQSPSPIRTLLAASVQRIEEFVVIDICANAFLHHMVRNIAGTLIEVGQGKRDQNWVKTVLESRDRGKAGMTAPADGLYFIGPDYPAHFGLPAMPTLWFPSIMTS